MHQRDEYGNTCGESAKLAAVSVNGQVSSDSSMDLLQCALVSNMTNCRLAPTQAGKYTVHVKVKDQPLKNSPFAMRVHPAPADVAKTKFDLPELPHQAKAGTPVLMKLHVRDSFGNARGDKDAFGKVSDKVDVEITGMDNPDTEVQGMGDGTFNVRFTLTRAGQYHVAVLLNGAVLPSTPFEWSVVPAI